MDIPRWTTNITDEDVETEIRNRLYYNAQYTDITDRPAQKGDIITIDFTGTINGKEFEGCSDTDYELELGSGLMPEDFENNIIGMKLKETKAFSITFPNDYAKELKGKTATYSVTLKSITTIKLPELTDDYVKETTDYSSVEEYRAALKDSLDMNISAEADHAASEAALNSAIDQATISDYPEELYQKEKKNIIKETGVNEEEIADLDVLVIESVYKKMVVYAIAKKENLTVTDEEYKTFVNNSYELYGYSSTDEFVKEYTEEKLRYELLYQKVLDFLSLNNNFVDTKPDQTD